VEATVVGTNGLGWRSVSFARVLQRLSGIVESLATGATGSTQLQRLKLRQGSAPFRIAGQVVSSRFAVKYNALTSTDVQGVFVSLRFNEYSLELTTISIIEVLLPGQGARKYVVASQEMFGSTLYL
jgi:hypothetical protein